MAYAGTTSSNGIKTTKRNNTILYFLDPTICTDDSNVVISSIYNENIDYKIGEYVTYEDKIYKCKQDLTSTSKFDNTKWIIQNFDFITLSSFTLSSYKTPFTFSIGKEHCKHSMGIENDILYDDMSIRNIIIYESNVEFELNGQF